MALGISGKVLMWLSCAIAAVTLPLGGWIFRDQSAKALHAARLESFANSQRLAAVLREDLWNLNYKNVENLMAVFMTQRDAVGMLVLDEKRVPVAGFLKGPHNAIEKSTVRASFDALGQQPHVFRQQAVVMRGSRYLGLLHAFFSTEAVRADLQANAWRTGGLLLAFFAVTLAVTYRTTLSSVLHPLFRLHDAVRGFAPREDAPGTLPKAAELLGQFRGQLAEAFPKASGDEIGALARAFGDMAERLRRSFLEQNALLEALRQKNVSLSREIVEHEQAKEEITRLNADLEHRVETRTAELLAMNQTLEASLESLQRAQAQLVVSEKMAALGGLVAGLAHEINTPVGIGVTAASHLEETVRELRLRYTQGTLRRSEMEALLQTLEETDTILMANLQRAAYLIRSFKQVAVDQSSDERRTFALGPYLEEILLSLHPRLKKTSHTVAVSCPEDLEIRSFPGAFSQIVTNLIINALTYAFAPGVSGKISIAARRAGADLTLEFSDNGIGMPLEVLRHIFEPFFTTRRSQGGSGLGLHIVYNLVTQTLQGAIECESTPGAGTTFILRLPLESKEP